MEGVEVGYRRCLGGWEPDQTLRVALAASPVSYCCSVPHRAQLPRGAHPVSGAVNQPSAASPSRVAREEVETAHAGSVFARTGRTSQADADAHASDGCGHVDDPDADTDIGAAVRTVDQSPADSRHGQRRHREAAAGEDAQADEAS